MNRCFLSALYSLILVETLVLGSLVLLDHLLLLCVLMGVNLLDLRDRDLLLGGCHDLLHHFLHYWRSGHMLNLLDLLDLLDLGCGH